MASSSSSNQFFNHQSDIYFLPESDPFIKLKVCLVRQSSVLLVHGNEEECCSMYIIELKRLRELTITHESTYKYRSPSIILPSKYFRNKKIYIFGSIIYFIKQFVFDNPESGRQVLAYKFPEEPVFNLVLKDTDLFQAPDMNGAKHTPVFIPTPDGRKFLVFSRRMIKMTYMVDDGYRHFEMYDPEFGVWHNLVGINPVWRMKQTIVIKCYTLIGKKSLLLYSNVGIFVWNLEFPYKEVKNLRDLPIPPPPPRTSGFFISIIIGGGKKLYLMANEAQDEETEVLMKYPYAFDLEGGGRSRYDAATSQNILLLDHVEGKECTFCISYMLLCGDSLIPYLVINVYKLNLQMYSKEMKLGVLKNRMYLPATKLMRSFNFLLDAETMDDHYLFDLVDFFSIL